jgi:hypothetical protein
MVRVKREGVEFNKALREGIDKKERGNRGSNHDKTNNCVVSDSIVFFGLCFYPNCGVSFVMDRCVS